MVILKALITIPALLGFFLPVALAETSRPFTLAAKSASPNSAVNDLAVVSGVGSSLAMLMPRSPGLAASNASLSGTMRELVSKRASLVFGTLTNSSSPSPPANNSTEKRDLSANNSSVKRDMPIPVPNAWTLASSAPNCHAPITIEPGAGTSGMYFEGNELKLNADGWTTWVGESISFRGCNVTRVG